MIFRAVSKMLSYWVNTASSMGEESKQGSTFVSTIPRTVAMGIPSTSPPPPSLTCNDLPDI